MSEIWVTGWGAVSPLGLGRDSVLRACRQAPRCFSTTTFEAGGKTGPVTAYQAALDAEGEEALAHVQTAVMDRATAMAVCAAEEAWSQAAGRVEPERAGIYWGTGMGGLHSVEQSYRRMLLENLPQRPMTVTRIMPNSAAAHLAARFNFHGPAHTFSVACASSAVAAGEALIALRAGRIDLAVVGGSEAMLVPGVLAAWDALRVLVRQSGGTVPHPCRPFSAARAGMVIGEGAAALVLERADHAARRGARPIAKLSGYGCTCDASSLVSPNAASEMRAMQQAIDDAGLVTGQIDCINAHATGTAAGDPEEAQAILKLFAGREIPVAATKALHGHLLGAAGALQAAMSVATLITQHVPPTPGCQPLDPACAGVAVAEQATPRAVDHVLSNSFAFGGANASLVFSRA